MIWIVVLLFYVITALIIYGGVCRFIETLGYRGLFHKRAEGESDHDFLSRIMYPNEKLYYRICVVYMLPILCCMRLFDCFKSRRQKK